MAAKEEIKRHDDSLNVAEQVRLAAEALQVTPEPAVKTKQSHLSEIIVGVAAGLAILTSFKAVTREPARPTADQAIKIPDTVTPIRDTRLTKVFRVWAEDAQAVSCGGAITIDRKFASDDRYETTKNLDDHADGSVTIICENASGLLQAFGTEEFPTKHTTAKTPQSEDPNYQVPGEIA